MRPIAIGRKNWLFVGSERAGHGAAVLTSLVASCKNNHVEPWAYLKDVFERWRISLRRKSSPSSCRTSGWRPTPTIAGKSPTLAKPNGCRSSVRLRTAGNANPSNTPIIAIAIINSTNVKAARDVFRILVLSRSIFRLVAIAHLKFILNVALLILSLPFDSVQESLVRPLRYKVELRALPMLCRRFGYRCQNSHSQFRFPCATTVAWAIE